MRWKYQKLIVNLINGLSALTNEPRSISPIREIFRALTGRPRQAGTEFGAESLTPEPCLRQ